MRDGGRGPWTFGGPKSYHSLIKEAEVIEGLKSIDKHAPRALTDGTRKWGPEATGCGISRAVYDGQRP